MQFTATSLRHQETNHWCCEKQVDSREVEKDGGKLLIDNREVIGEVVTTKLGVKPIYASIGHRESLKIVTEIILHCSKVEKQESCFKSID